MRRTRMVFVVFVLALTLWPIGAALAAGCGDVPERCRARREVLSWCEENRAACQARLPEYEAQCSEDNRDACHRARWVREYLGQDTR